MLKRGVCQDYAHLMIAVCRSVGLPSRYVSGYHFVGDLQGATPTSNRPHMPGWRRIFRVRAGWASIRPTMLK
ncbi:transglutaminase family protein [Paenibacillus rhizoplanae]